MACMCAKWHIPAALSSRRQARQPCRLERGPQRARWLRRILVRIGGEQLLAWGGADPAHTLHALLAAVSRLLQPDIGDSPSLGVGEARGVPSPAFGTFSVCVPECAPRMFRGGQVFQRGGLRVHRRWRDSL